MADAPLLEEKRKLLLGWLTGLRVLHRANFTAAARYEQFNRLLGVPVIIATSVVGSAVFATAGKAESAVIQLIAGGVSILATILSSLQTFLAYAALSQKHKEAATKYGELRTELEVLLASDLQGLMGWNQKIESIRTRWNDIDKEAPTIPKKLYDQTERQVSREAGAMVHP